MIRDWDDAYENSAYIAGAAELPALWAAQAAKARAAYGARCETIAYGPHPRHALDLIQPETPAKGLAVFIHGGYWVACSKADWTHLAAGLVAQGYAVAIPSYRLAPEARLGEIAADVAAAVTAAAARVAGPVRLCGHSAGGHLAARLVADGTPLGPEILHRIEKVVPISGLFDLRPLARTAYATPLALGGPDVMAESPLMHLPAPAFTGAVHLWVGGGERPEFLRQSRLMALAWQPFLPLSLTEEGDENHFSVLGGLEDPSHPLVGAIAA